MTLFEQAVQAVREGKVEAPKVTMGTAEVDYFRYQLATTKFALGIMAGGMKMRGKKFSDFKNYYGLKARNAKDALPEFEKLMNDFLNK